MFWKDLNQLATKKKVDGMQSFSRHVPRVKEPRLGPGTDHSGDVLHVMYDRRNLMKPKIDKNATANDRKLITIMFYTSD